MIPVRFTAIALSALLLAASVTSCIRINPLKADFTQKTGQTVAKTYKVGSFDVLDAAGCDVRVTVGIPDGTARLEGPAESVDKTEISCKRGVLSVGISKLRSAEQKPTLYVTLNTLREITATVSSNVKFDNGISAERIELTATTAGSIDIPSITAQSCEINSTTAATVIIGTLSTGTIEACATTAADIRIKGGSAQRVDLVANTAGSINCSGMHALAGEASAETGSNIKCSVKDLSSSQSNSGGHISNH